MYCKDLRPELKSYVTDGLKIVIKCLKVHYSELKLYDTRSFK